MNQPAADISPADAIPKLWGSLATGVLALALAAVPLDSRFAVVLVGLGLAAAVLLVVRLVWAAGTLDGRWVAAIGAGWAAATLAGMAVLRDTWVSGSGDGATPWLAMGFALAMVVGLAQAAPRGAHNSQLATVARWCLAALLLVVWFSVLASRLPRVSLSNFAHSGLGPQAALMLLAVVALREAPARCATLLRVAIVVWGAWMLFALGVWLLAMVGGEDWRQRFAELGYLRGWRAGVSFLEVRLQAPFVHHNRLGLYALLGGIIGAGGLLLESRRAWRVASGVLLGAALVVLLTTQTRGAWLGAAGAGGALLVVLRGQRSVAGGVGLVLLLLAGLVAVAAPWRERVQPLLTPSQSLTADVTVQSRTVGYQGAWLMIRERPVTGWGYGWHAFQIQYTRDIAARVGDAESKRHPHNVVLELGAWAGLAAPLLFVFGVGALVLACWRRGSRPFAVMMALVVGALVFGMTSSFLHYGFPGALVMLAAALAGLSRPSSHEARV